jgi:hypothetical protein
VDAPPTHLTLKEYDDMCYKLYKLLKLLFPDATGWYNGTHVITQIGSDIFDIDGVVLFSYFLKELDCVVIETGNRSGNYYRIGSEHYPFDWMENTFKNV